MNIKSKLLSLSLFLVSSIFLFSFDIPDGWFKAGSDPDSYEMGISEGSGTKGGNAVTIKSTADKIKGFGTIMTGISSHEYLGKRVRMTAWIKTENVRKWSGIWLRVDAKEGDYSLAFDNMHDGKKNRSIKGTTDWAKYDIVLDVPKNANRLAYGALIAGTGQIWFDKIEFEVVDKSVPTTGRDKKDMSKDKSEE